MKKKPNIHDLLRQKYAARIEYWLLDTKAKLKAWNSVELHPPQHQFRLGDTVALRKEPPLGGWPDIRIPGFD